MKTGSKCLARYVCFILCILTVANVSYAALDFLPAPFRTFPEGQNGTTFQSWDFSTAADLMSDTDLNQFGTAAVTPSPGSVHHNSFAGFQGVWGLDGIMSVSIPSDPQGQTTSIWVQITYRGLASPNLTINGTPTPASQVMPLPNGWFHGVYAINQTTSGVDLVEIRHLEPTSIDSLIIETNTIPEPVTLALMGLGALLLKRKK